MCALIKTSSFRLIFFLNISLVMKCVPDGSIQKILHCLQHPTIIRYCYSYCNQTLHHHWHILPINRIQTEREREREREIEDKSGFDVHQMTIHTHTHFLVMFAQLNCVMLIFSLYFYFFYQCVSIDY